MRKERLYYLDLIKLIALVSVFTIHFTKALESSGISFSFRILPDYVFGLYLGAFGVTLFFIASGASMMYVYGDTEIALGDYYRKRFLGIYPMFWLAWVVFFAAKYVINPEAIQAIPRGTILFTLIGADGQVGVYTSTYYLLGEWFLLPLIVLYVLFPFLKKLLIRFPLLTMGFFVLVTLWSVFRWTDGYLSVDAFFLHRIPEFLFGMAFIRYLKKPRWYLAVLSVCILMVMHLVQFPELNSMLLIWLVGIPTFLVMGYLFSFCKGGWMVAISRFADRFCYPVFLTHHIIMYLLLPYWNGQTFGVGMVIGMYVLTMGLTIAASAGLLALTPRVIAACRWAYAKL